MNHRGARFKIDNPTLKYEKEEKISFHTPSAMNYCNKFVYSTCLCFEEKYYISLDISASCQDVWLIKCLRQFTIVLFALLFSFFSFLLNLFYD